MTTIITRLYPNRRQANAVVNALKAEEFTAAQIGVVAHAAKEDKQPDLKAIEDEIRALRVYPKAAATYARHVAEGNVLVVLAAPVGQANRGTVVADRFPAIDAGVKYPDNYLGTAGPYRSRPRRSMTSLLSSDQMFLTNRPDPERPRSSTPFSSMFGLPLLSGSRRRTRLITGNTTPFSSFFGMGTTIRQWPHARLITGNTTPFSSFFGIPLLWQRKRR